MFEIIKVKKSTSPNQKHPSGIAIASQGNLPYKTSKETGGGRKGKHKPMILEDQPC
jgi:hypothetical protein